MMSSSANLPVEPHRQVALVTGATGAIGPAIVAALMERGYRVRALVRAVPPPDLLPPGVELIQGDITQPKDVLTAVAGCDCIFHLAARLHINNPTAAMLAEYERINVDGTRYLTEAACRAGVKRIVFFSTISVYGPSSSGNVFDETSAPAPETLYARTKYAAENVVLEARDSTGQPIAVVLRLAAVYGPNMKGNYNSLLRSVKRGVFVPVGDGCNRRTLVFQTDVAQAAVLAATSPQAAGRIYNVSDGTVHTLQEILMALYSATGRRMPRWHIPDALLRSGLAAVAAPFTLLGRSAPIGPYLVDKLTEDVAVQADRIQRELGFSPEVNLEKGWKVTADALLND